MGYWQELWDETACVLVDVPARHVQRKPSAQGKGKRRERRPAGIHVGWEMNTHRDDWLGGKKTPRKLPLYKQPKLSLQCWTHSKLAHMILHRFYASSKWFYLFHNLGVFAEFFLQRRQELRAIFQLFTTRIIVAWTESQIESILTLAPLAAPPWPPPTCGPWALPVVSLGMIVWFAKLEHHVLTSGWSRLLSHGCRPHSVLNPSWRSMHFQLVQLLLLPSPCSYLASPWQHTSLMRPWVPLSGWPLTTYCGYRWFYYVCLVTFLPALLLLLLRFASKMRFAFTNENFSFIIFLF